MCLTLLLLEFQDVFDIIVFWNFRMFLILLLLEFQNVFDTIVVGISGCV